MNYVLCLSGGIDSTCLLYTLQAAGQGVRAVAYHYGQKHAQRELAAARSVADHAKIDLEVVSLPHLGGSALTEADLEISTGPYEAHEIPSTNVPNRNMIFLAFAIAKALREGAGAVAYAAHAGDHEGYPDCRPAFAAPLAKATSSLGVLLDAPFLDLTKQQVVCLGLAYGAPLHLTYSCYRGGAKHCGDCGTCIERRLAFRLEDPTEYA